MRTQIYMSDGANQQIGYEQKVIALTNNRRRKFIGEECAILDIYTHIKAASTSLVKILGESNKTPAQV